MPSSPKIILASASPRRKELLEGLGLAFDVVPSQVDEIYPADLALEKVPLFLAELKVDSLLDKYPNEVVIAADTVVICGKELLGKPIDVEDAEKMLRKLSGQRHEVITGVCIAAQGKKHMISECTEVFFKELTDNEITFYVDQYKPFDKAGAYGVQEWIGYVAVEKIIGSFYNVMGLPVDKVYEIVTPLIKGER